MLSHLKPSLPVSRLQSFSTGHTWNCASHV